MFKSDIDFKKNVFLKSLIFIWTLENESLKMKFKSYFKLLSKHIKFFKMTYILNQTT